MQLEYSILPAAIALVDRRPEIWPHAIFATISPNPKVKHTIKQIVNGKTTTVKKPYGMLPQRVQFEYCTRIVKSAYIFSLETKIFGTWELNKEGNVHFHLILSDPFICNKSALSIFQRDVMNNHLVTLNLVKSKSPKDFMNNIVFVNDSVEARIKYMTKDMHMNLPILPYYYFDHYHVIVPQGDVKPAAGPPRAEPPEESEGPQFNKHIRSIRDLKFGYF